MTKIISPLRYPGSKQRVLNKIIPFWNYIKNSVDEYREPFLGGASIFLNLDLENKKVLLNDKDEKISTLFTVIRDNPKELCAKIRDITPTIELWHEIRSSDYKEEIDIAFRTLFLNRTNYSGILNASPIGGFRQESEYPIHCRWSPDELEKRIIQCSKKLQSCDITSKDFFFSIIKPSHGEVFLFLDPPYYEKGNKLYDVFMSEEDHIRLRDLLIKTRHHFLLTYDNCDKIKELYGSFNKFYLYETDWIYSASTVIKEKRTIGKELFISNFKVDNIAKDENIRRVL